MVARARDLEPPAPAPVDDERGRTQASIRITWLPEHKARLKEIARSRGKSVSQLVEDELLALIERSKPQRPRRAIRGRRR